MRIELKPETEEDERAVSGILARERIIRAVLNESNPLIYRGDSDEFGIALIISSHKVKKTATATGAPTMGVDSGNPGGLAAGAEPE